MLRSLDFRLLFLLLLQESACRRPVAHNEGHDAGMAMESLKTDMYDEAFRLWDMAPEEISDDYGPAGNAYRFENDCGRGEYWVYFRDNMFAVNAFDMRFFHTGVMRYRHSEHLTVGYYERADLVLQSSCHQPRAGSISTYIAEEGAEYVARYLPGSAIRATSMTISPDYYRDYLKKRFGDIPDMRQAFSLVDGRQDFPELVSLFKQVRSYRGCGMAADLFYEGAVAETLALIMKRADDIEIEGLGTTHALPSPEDREALEKLGGYIKENLGTNLTLEELARHACMGQTKFKLAFKAHYGTSPKAFVTEARMDRAAELLHTTDQPIAFIAQRVGYRKPGAFTEAFRRRTGVLPSALRARIARAEQSVETPR